MCFLWTKTNALIYFGCFGHFRLIPLSGRCVVPTTMRCPRMFVLKAKLNSVKGAHTHTQTPTSSWNFSALVPAPPAEYESGEWIMNGRSFFVDLSHPPPHGWLGLARHCPSVFQFQREQNGDGFIENGQQVLPGLLVTGPDDATILKVWKFVRPGQTRCVHGKKGLMRPGCHSLQCRSRPGWVCVWVCVERGHRNTHS